MAHEHDYQIKVKDRIDQRTKLTPKQLSDLLRTATHAEALGSGAAILHGELSRLVRIADQVITLLRNVNDLSKQLANDKIVSSVLAFQNQVDHLIEWRKPVEPEFVAGYGRIGEKAVRAVSRTSWVEAREHAARWMEEMRSQLRSGMSSHARHTKEAADAFSMLMGTNPGDRFNERVGPYVVWIEQVEK